MERYKVSIDVGLEQGEAPAPREQEELRRFHVAILGDFSARDGAEAAPDRGDASPRRREVDADNVWSFAGFRPTVEIRTGSGATATLTLDSFDAFHPDHLRSVVPAELGDEGEAPASDEAGVSEDDPAEAISADPPAGDGRGGDVLGAILAESDASAPRRSGPPDDLGSFIEDAVRPHLVRPDRTSDARARADRAVRRVLRDPAVEMLEATWRPVLELVTRCTPHRHIHLHLIDCGRARFDALAEATDPDGLARGILGAGVGTEDVPPFSVLVAAWDLAGAPSDLRTIGWLAALSGRIGAACVAGLSDPAAAAASDGWASLRARPDAALLAVFTPRILARLPYGDGMDECAPRFEESLPGTPRRHVWSPAAVFGSWLLIRALSPAGPESRFQGGWRLEGLPFYTGRADAGSAIQRCLERVFSDGEADALHVSGMMPLRPGRDLGTASVSGLRMVGEAPQNGA